MKESEVWEEVRHIEEGMKIMHDSIDKIMEGCSNEDAENIRITALMLKNRITRAFEMKFPLVSAILRYFRAP